MKCYQRSLFYRYILNDRIPLILIKIKLNKHYKNRQNKFALNSYRRLIYVYPVSAGKMRTEKIQSSRWTDFLDLYLSTSGFFAIVKVYSYYERKKWFPFVLWCLITVIFFGVTVYLITKLKISYDNSPYTTKIQLKNDNSLPHPRILICRSMRIVNNESRLMYNLSERQIDYLMAYQLQKSGEPVNFTNEENQTLSNWYKELANQTDFDISDFLYNLTYTPCTQFFHSPFLQEMGVDVELACDHHMTSMLTDKGFCELLTFQAPTSTGTREDLTQVVPGMAGGLEFYLKPPTALTHYSVFVGFPQNPMNKNPILVSSGQEVWISTNGRFNHRIRQYDNCTDRTQLEHFPYYTQAACLYECIVKAVNSNCGCFLIGFNISKPNNSRWCEPSDYFKCYVPSYINVAPFYYKPELRSCNFNCNLPCDDWDYRFSLTYQLRGDSEVRIRHFFENLSYEDITSVSLITFEGILGSVGGIIGFWFGANLLSVFHLLTWLGELMCFGLNKLCGKQQNQSLY